MATRRGGSLGTAVLDLAADGGGLRKDLGQAEQRANETFERLSKRSRQVGIAFAAIGAGLLAGTVVAVNAAGRLDTALREVGTLTPEVANNMDAFRDAILGVSQALGVNAVEATRGLYQAISAGIPADNAIEFLTTAGRAAIAGVTDIATSVEGLTTVMNAFAEQNISAGQAADIMFATVRGGKTTFDELSSFLFQAAPLAAAAGVSFQEVSAGLATLTAQGVPTRVASTQVRAAIQGLLRPSDELTQIFQDAGHASAESAVRQIGFAEAIEIVRDATGGNIGQLTLLLGSIEAVQGALGVTGPQAETFARHLDNITNSTGAADEAFQLMNDGIEQARARLHETFNALVITVGQELIPVLQELLDTVQPFLENSIQWVKENRELAGTFAKVATAAGLVLVPLGGLLIIIGPLIGGVTALIGVLGGLQGALVALRIAAFAVAASPLGVVIAIAGVATVAIIGFKRALEGTTDAPKLFRRSLIQGHDALDEYGEAAIEATRHQAGLTKAVDEGTEELSDLTQAIEDAGGPTARTAKQIADFLEALRNISTPVERAEQALVGIADRTPPIMRDMFDEIDQVAEEALSAFVGYHSDAAQAARDLAETVTDTTRVIREEYASIPGAAGEHLDALGRTQRSRQTEGLRRILEANRRGAQERAEAQRVATARAVFATQGEFGDDGGDRRGLATVRGQIRRAAEAAAEREKASGKGVATAQDFADQMEEVQVRFQRRMRDLLRTHDRAVMDETARFDRTLVELAGERLETIADMEADHQDEVADNLKKYHQAVASATQRFERQQVDVALKYSQAVARIATATRNKLQDLQRGTTNRLQQAAINHQRRLTDIRMTGARAREAVDLRFSRTQQDIVRQGSRREQAVQRQFSRGLQQLGGADAQRAWELRQRQLHALEDLAVDSQNRLEDAQVTHGRGLQDAERQTAQQVRDAHARHAQERADIERRAQEQRLAIQLEAERRRQAAALVFQQAMAAAELAYQERLGLAQQERDTADEEASLTHQERLALAEQAYRAGVEKAGFDHQERLAKARTDYERKVEDAEIAFRDRLTDVLDTALAEGLASVQGTYGAIVSSTRSMVDGVIRELRRFPRAPSMPGIPSAEIPIFDSGAIVTSPTIGGLSMDGNDEGVFPLRDLDKYLTRGGGVTNNFYGDTYGLDEIDERINEGVLAGKRAGLE